MTVQTLKEMLSLTEFHLAEPEREVSGGYAGDLLSWVIFSERAREDGRDAIAVFGCGVGFTILGMGIGYMVGGLVIAPAISSGFIDATSIVLASVVFLFTVAFLIIPESALSASPESDENNTTPEQHE